MNYNIDQYEVWFVTGTQHLYGEETLKQVGFTIANYYEIKGPYNKEWMVFTVRNSN